MTSCTSCGHESASTARFCSECGLPLVSTRAGAEVIAGTNKSDWLTSTAADDDRAVRTPGVRRGVKHPLPFLVGGLIVAFVAWNLFRAPTTEVAGLAGGLAAAGSAPSTTEPVPSDRLSADDDTSSTTTLDPGQDGVDVSTLDGALTRYDLYAQQSGRLLRVDLASGEVESHDVTGQLIGEFGGRLYFIDGRTLSWLPVVDLDVGPSVEFTVSESVPDYVAANVTGTGLVHITAGSFSASGPDLTMIRIDLTTGTIQQANPGSYGILGLVEVPGAGLFELTGSDFRLLADGSVRFYGERLIVIEQCDAPGTCRRYWLDRETGEEVDRAPPEPSSGWLLGADGRVAVTFGDRGRTFVDTETGEPVPDLSAEFSDDTVIPEDLTPDSRFLAAVPSSEGGNVRIHDLVTGTSWTIDLPRTFNPSKVLFVPKTADDDGP